MEPALVILDVKLPKRSGLEVLKTMSLDEQAKLLPVVMLTTSDKQEDIRESYQYGANS
jgi:CheY-like chemotaxis protein